MLSSIKQVCSCENFGLAGDARKLMTGYLRHGNFTDMQTSRVSDAESYRLWDQLLKRDSGTSGGVSIDEYRLAVCAHL